jgi:biotin transport system substrate-specific component
MGRDITLLHATLGDLSLVKKAFLVLAGSLFIAIAAQISVPMFPVPMTLQVLAILLVGFAFGSRLGAATVMAYLAEGAMGLPVFANGLNGVAFAGPTAGFLLGFVAMAWAAGFAAERGLAKGFVSTMGVSLGLAALLYVPGIAWPMALAGSFGAEAGWVGQAFTGYYWAYFIAPFLIGDAIKAVLAALITTGAWKVLARR